MKRIFTTSILVILLALLVSALGVVPAQATLLDSGAQLPDGLSAADWAQLQAMMSMASLPGQQAYLKASNTEVNDSFGYSIAISADTVVVGAYAEDSSATGINGDEADNSALTSGAVYVFTRSGSTWSQQAYLKASNAETNDYFGISVDISGDTLVVGAYCEGSNATGVNGNEADDSAVDAGAAYIFTRSGTTWSQQAYLKASNTETEDYFGNAVAISGDTVAVSAYGEDSSVTGVNGNEADNAAIDSGAVYIFTRSGVTWSQQAYLKASNSEEGDNYGNSVDISGDTVVVGANLEDGGVTGVNGNDTDNSAPTSGAAYVYTRSGTTWSQQAYLKASNTGEGDSFGSSVAISGDTLAVGANTEGSNARGINGDGANNLASKSGAVYIFTRSDTTWSQQAYVKASNTQGSDFFGSSVAISADKLVVGAYAEDSNTTGVNGNQADNTASGSGAAYIFNRSGGAWSQQAYLKASNTGAYDNFGFSVAVFEDTVVVGANGEDSNATGVDGDGADNSELGSGAAYVFFPLPAPSDFSKTAPDNSSTDAAFSLTLSWQASNYQTDYQYCIDANINSTCDSGGAWTSTQNATSANLSGLAASTQYEWQVRADNGEITQADGGTWWTFTTVADTTLPVVIVPADKTVEAASAAGAVVDFSTEVSATDDSFPVNLPVTCEPASGSTFPITSTTVNCEASDNAGNKGTAFFTITVTDTTPPTVAVPADKTVEATSSAGAVVDFSVEVSATDSVSPANPAVTCDPASGSTFPMTSPTTVTCEAIDRAGNKGTASFTITVTDTTPPVVAVPADKTVEATSSAGAVVDFITEVSATDEVSPANPIFLCNYDSGSTFPIATTKVTCEASDDAGNKGSASFTITVKDTTAPSITVPANKTVEAASSAGAVVDFSAEVSATDAVSPANPTVTCGPVSGFTFPIATTTVACEASDDAGNQGSVSFTVTVSDSTPPSITVPANKTVEATSSAGAAVDFSAEVSATDAVSPANPTVSCDPSSGSTFPLGDTTVNCEASDAAGNKDTASFIVTVSDTILPDTSLIGKPAVFTTLRTATFTFSGVDATSMTFMCKLDAGVYALCVSAKNYSSLAIGKHTFSVYAVDAAGNLDATPATYTWVIQAERALNGGFNLYSGTSKLPTKWLQVNFSSFDGKDTSVKKEGLASVKITGQSNKTKTLTQTLNLSGAKDDVFNFTFYARTSGLPTNSSLCQAQVIIYLTNGSKQIDKTNCVASTNFKLYSKTIKALSAYNKVEIKFIYSKASGTAWFDLVSLLK